MSRSNRRPRWAAAGSLVLVTLLVGCAIQPDAQPRDIPEEDQGAFAAEVATGDEAAGSSLIFLLAPHDPDEPQLLRSVMRGEEGTDAVIRSLLSGPNRTERAAGVETAIPQGLTLNTTPRLLGRTLTIDVAGLDELAAVDLQFAVAQIVTTATAIEGVDKVQIRVDGENRSWPRGDGELTEQALTAYDYPGFVESTQPAYPAIPSAVR